MRMRMRIRIREDDDALSASSSEYAAEMFARGRSTRSQMKSPSIAQRGEGGVRGGSGEFVLLSNADRRRSGMQKHYQFNSCSHISCKGQWPI